VSETGRPEEILQGLERRLGAAEGIAAADRRRLEGALAALRDGTAAGAELVRSAYRVLKDLVVLGGGEDGSFALLDEEAAAVGLRRQPPSPEQEEELARILGELRRRHLRSVLALSPIRSTRRIDVRLVALDDRPDGSRLRTFDGLAEGPEGAPRWVRDAAPEAVVTVTPFLDLVLDHVRSRIVPELSGAEEEMAEGITRCAAAMRDRLTPRERCGAEAEPAVRVLESLLRGRKTEPAVEVLGQIDEFYRHVRRGGGPRGRDAALLRTAEELERAGGEANGLSSCLDEGIRELRRGVEESDYRVAAKGLAGLLRRVGSHGGGEDEVRERLEELCREALVGPLGAVVVDDVETARHERAGRESDFREEVEARPHPTAAHGTILEVLKPGVRFEHEFVARPVVLVSRGRRNRVHDLIDRLDGALRGGSEEERRVLGRRLEAAAEEAYRTDVESHGGRAGLGLLFRTIAPAYARLGPRLREVVTEELRREFGAEILSYAEGDLLRGVRPDGSRPGDVHVREWVAGDEPAGTVLRQLRIGLRAPCLGRPRRAILVLASGPRVADPFLLRLRSLAPPADPEIRAALERCLAGDSESRPLLEVRPEDRERVTGAAMDLLARLEDRRDDLPGLSREDVAAFLEGLGLERFPDPRALLSSRDLRESSLYEIAYVWDERRGAGRLVEVERTGWRARDAILRRARVRVSLGVDPALRRAVETAIRAAVEAGDPSPALLARVRRIYAEEIEPRLADPEVVGRMEGAEGRRRLATRAALLLDAVERLRAAVTDGSEEARRLDEVLDQDLPEALEGLGLAVFPVTGQPVGEAGPELEIRRVFSGTVPEGRAVRVRRRAVREAAGEWLRPGIVEVSAGEPPVFVHRLRQVREACGDGEAPELDRLLGRLREPGALPDLSSESAAEDLAGDLAGALGEADALARRLEDRSRDRALAIQDAVEGLAEALAREGIRILPRSLDEPLRLPEFSTCFPAGPEEAVVLGPEALPVGRVVRVERRAVLVGERLVSPGSVRIGGGPRDELRDRVERLGELLPELAEIGAEGSREIGAAQVAEVVRVIEGGHGAARGRKVRATLRVLRAAQGAAAPAGREVEVREIVRETLDDLEERFGLRVLPCRTDDAGTLAEVAHPADRIETAFSDRERGTIEVERFGWRDAEEEEPFVVRVSLGPKPPYLDALERLPGIGDARADEGGWKGAVAGVLARFRDADADPSDVDGFVLPALGEIHDRLVASRVEPVVREAFHRFLEATFGVLAYPAIGTPLADLGSDRLRPEDLSIAYDAKAPDLTVVAVDRPGLRLGDRVLRLPRFTVGRRRRTPDVDVLRERVRPVLEQLAGRTKGAARERLEGLRAETVACELLPEARRDGEEGRGRLVRLVLELRRLVPLDWTVSTSDGIATVEGAWREIVERLDVRLPGRPAYVEASAAVDQIRRRMAELEPHGETGARIIAILERELVRDLVGCVRAFEKVLLGEGASLSEADEREYLVQGLNALHASLDECLRVEGLSPPLAAELRAELADLIRRHEAVLARDHKVVGVPIRPGDLKDREQVAEVIREPTGLRRPWHRDVVVLRPCLRHVETNDIRQRAVVRVFE
jgi:hypothetical protein